MVKFIMFRRQHCLIPAVEGGDWNEHKEKQAKTDLRLLREKLVRWQRTAYVRSTLQSVGMQFSTLH